MSTSIYQSIYYLYDVLTLILLTQKPPSLLKPLPIPDRPFAHILMDFLFLPKVTNNSTTVFCDHIWVIVDRFSKYTIILPLPLNYDAVHIVDLFYTATASPRILVRIRKGLGISNSAIFTGEPINRLNLFYGVRIIEGSVFGAEDIDFLVSQMEPGTPIQYSTHPENTGLYRPQRIASKVAEAIRMVLPSL